VLSVLCLGLLGQGAQPLYDGHWWRSISQPEQDGFLFGWFDCYQFEYKGRDSFSKSMASDRALIARAYESSPSDLSQPVSDVIIRLRDTSGEKPEETGGEPARGRHHGNDGLYWFQIQHTQQLGFVEGYLQCHEHLAHNKGGVFSKAPDEYRALISRWYQINEQTGDINGEREPEAIADVLFKVRSGT